MEALSYLMLYTGVKYNTDAGTDTDTGPFWSKLISKSDQMHYDSGTKRNVYLGSVSSIFCYTKKQSEFRPFCPCGSDLVWFMVVSL